MVSPFGDSSRILAITKVFDEWKRNILDISDTVRVETEKANKKSRISSMLASMLASASPTDMAILKAIVRIGRDGWISRSDLEDLEHEYEWDQIMHAVLLADRHGLIIPMSGYWPVDWDAIGYDFQLDPHLKEALLR
jgi:hypothetical protein